MGIACRQSSVAEVLGICGDRVLDIFCPKLIALFLYWLTYRGSWIDLGYIEAPVPDWMYMNSFVWTTYLLHYFPANQQAIPQTGKGQQLSCYIAKILCTRIRFRDIRKGQSSYSVLTELLHALFCTSQCTINLYWTLLSCQGQICRHWSFIGSAHFVQRFLNVSTN